MLLSACNAPILRQINLSHQDLILRKVLTIPGAVAQDKIIILEGTFAFHINHFGSFLAE